MGKNISRPKQVTDWVARLEKLEQALAAESDSGLLVQPAWIEKECARRLRHQFTGPKNIGLPLSHCQIQRLLNSRQTEAGVARTLIARLKATEFLPNSYRIPGFLRWVLTSTTGYCEHVPSH